MKESMQIRSKLPDVGTTIFSVMSAMAQKYNAINLSQGFPDFDPHPVLLQFVNKYMSRGKNQYAPMPGLLSLREAIAAKLYDTYGYAADPENEITITAGGTQAIFTAIIASIETGDEVIVFDPAYDCYSPSIRLAGGVPVHITLHAPQFRIPWNEVKSKVNEKTKMIILNTPHNPSASVLENSDIDELLKIVRNKNLYILSDEVYEHIIFDRRRHESILLNAELAERSFVVFSFGKTYHCTGWKVGYCVAPRHLMQEFRKVHQYNVFSVNTPIQHAFAEFIPIKEHYIGLKNIYQEKRDLFWNALEQSKFTPLPCKGTYFQLASFEKISGLSDMEFAEWMTMYHKLAVIPVSAFYKDGLDQHVVRFCFAKENETLMNAADILLKI